jgi:hypothetical protein
VTVFFCDRAYSQYQMCIDPNGTPQQLLLRWDHDVDCDDDHDDNNDDDDGCWC